MFLNLVAVIVFGICWGSAIPLLKFAISAGHHPMGMMVWQLSVAVLVLGAALLMRRKPLHIRVFNCRYLLFVSLIGTLVPNTFSLFATQHLPAGILAIVIATAPIMSLIIALVARVELFSWKRFAGVMIGVASLILIAVPETSLPDPSKAPWVLVAILAPLCYAAEGNYVAVKAPKNLDAVTTLFGASVCGLLLLLPLVYGFGWQVPVWVVWDGSRWTIVLAALGHVTAYTGYLWLLGRVGAVFTSQIAYIVTLTGVFASVLFLGERYGWLLWLAVALMFVALTLVKPVRQLSDK